MTETSKGRRILENSYKLETPADNKEYYKDFAPVYDEDFAIPMGWSYPREVANAYREVAGANDVPIADLGCGTGLVAGELGGGQIVDGMDISPEMLAVAKHKGLYRELYDIDLTGDLSPISNDYGAVLSAGTFTHGHLGPEVLPNFLSIGRAGAVFVIGVNKAHFQKQEFQSTLQAMVDDGLIRSLQISEIRMYEIAGHAHSNDVALVVRYRKV